MSRYFIFLCFSFHATLNACTTILIGSNCTLDGSTILAHNEDMGYHAVGKLWHKYSNVYDIPYKINIPYIPFALNHTYAYWASGNAQAGIGLVKQKTSSKYDNVLVGINDYGLALACNWMHSKEQAKENIGINRYALRQLVLESNKTAIEAVKFIGNMVETYGQADWGGLTYCVADKNEAWIIETTATQWVARKILKDEIHTVANQFTIDEKFDLHSRNLFSFAKQNGWYSDNSPFSFRKVYGKTAFLDTHYDIRRSTRVKEILSPKIGIITINDVKEVLRDRYDGTEDFSMPILQECWRDLCIEKNIMRPLSTNITQSSSIAHLRNNINDDYSAVLWYSCATPNFNGYFPIYAKSDRVSDVYSFEGIEEENAWQKAKKLQVEGDKNYHKNIIVAQNLWKNFENEIQIKMNLLENMDNSTTKTDLLYKLTNTTSLDILRIQSKLLNAFTEEK